MTTEEIEKAAEDYSKEYWREFSGMTNVEESIIYSMDNFKAGVEFADKHWQEKTRWIPIEERLPVFGGKVRTILVKTSDNLYSFLWVMQEISLLDFELQSYTHWKEIE